MRYALRLYVTGRTSASQQAIANLERLCAEESLAGQYLLEVIDVLEHPELAERDKILATPTLLKSLPPPLRKIIGDLSNRTNLLLGLDLRPTESAPEDPSQPSEPA